MNRFNRTVKPQNFSPDDLDYLQGLVGTTRVVEDKQITFISILSIRELAILYEVTLDGISAVAKVAIRYEILQEKEEIFENVLSDEGIDCEWDSEKEEWLLTDEQQRIVMSKVEEAIQTFKYTDTFIKDIRLESSIHEKIPECDFIPKFYGTYECEDIFIYVLEKLGSDLFKIRPDLEIVAVNVIEALRRLHTVKTQSYILGYFHRDVTPGNILNNGRGGVCLIDFGITCEPWACKQYSEGEEKVYSLTTGNPAFAPSISFIGCYNYAGDLEGLCCTLEFLYSGPETLRWGELFRSAEWNDSMSEKSYQLRQSFIPKNEKVKKLLDYVRSIGNDMPDYDRCIAFFQ